MLSLFSVLVGLVITTPRPSDYNLALSLLDNSCQYKDLHEVIPVKITKMSYYGSEYDGYEPSIPYTRLYAAFAKVCTDLELSDGREYGYENLVDFRQRAALYPKYPNPLKFCFNISKFEMGKNKTFIYKYRENLINRRKNSLELDRNEILSVSIKECDELYLFWDSMADAAGVNIYLSFNQRKYALMRVYDYLGEEDFYNGNYPPIAPYWQFNEYYP